MQISGLPATSSVASSDVMVIEVGGITYKVTAGTLATMLQAIGSPLPVNKGGTGLTANPSMLVNLADSSVANVLQASPRPGVTGILPLAHGGLGKDFSVATNAGFHNSIYRGKNLGTSITSAQWTAIGNGTFDDLFIGDYWAIDGVNWRVAGFDYWYNTGDQNCTTHHVVIVPDANLLAGDGSTTHWMNATNTTEGAYVGSDFYTGNNENTGKAQCISKVESAFGAAHILSHREYLQNAVTNGYSSAGAWYDSTVEIMNEQMVYGCRVYGNCINGTSIPNLFTIDKSQLPLFALEPNRIGNRATWWLRDVVSATLFAYVTDHGCAGYHYASNASIGVRPAFGIKA